MSRDDRILNQIDEAKEFGRQTGIVLTEEDINDPLKIVQAQILRLFWTISNRLITSELELEVQHLILQDTVQMAKILKDWSLGDKTLGIKNQKDKKQVSVAEVLNHILDAAQKRGVAIELPLGQLVELQRTEAEQEEDKMESLGIPSSNSKKIEK